MKKETYCLHREEIIDKCEGCLKIFFQEGLFKFSSSRSCNAYLYPASKWRFDRKCPMATHLEKGTDEKKKINPLKQSKRSMEEMK